MEALPLEMVCEIAQHLTERDLASCTGVSKYWREIFGADAIWRPRCDRASEEHLRKTPCRVKPEFQIPKSEITTLRPVGKWRAAFMREKHLFKNWMRGNFVEDEFDHHCSQVLFIKDDFVITNGNGVIRLLNTSVTPAICVAKYFTRGFCRCKLSVIRNDTFIVMEDWDVYSMYLNTISVIQVDWEQFGMKLKRSFHLGEDKVPLTFYDIVNNVLVVVNNSMLHFWDVDEGVKLKSESFMFNFDEIEVFRYDPPHDEKGENLGVVGMTSTDVEECGSEGLYWSTHRYHFFLYNVKDLEFWQFTKEFMQEIQSFVFVKNYVAIGFGTWIEVYNYETNHHVHTFACNVHFPLWTAGNSFIFVKPTGEVGKLSLSNGVFKYFEEEITGGTPQPVRSKCNYMGKSLFSLILYDLDEVKTVVITTPSSVLPIKGDRRLFDCESADHHRYSKVWLMNTNTLPVLRHYW